MRETTSKVVCGHQQKTKALVDLKELDLKGQFSVLRNNGWVTAGTVSVIRRDVQNGLLAKRQLRNTCLMQQNEHRLVGEAHGEQGVG